MPTSRPYPLTWFCNFVLNYQPKTVLDIGIGSGKYGFLAREYTDNWNNYLDENKVRIDGIEIFPEYVKNIHYKIYDTIYIADALEILPDLKVYDLIIASDILEHFCQKDGIKFLDLIKQHCKKAIVITPNEKWYTSQGAVYDNTNEIHLWCWKEEDLKQYGEIVKFESCNALIIGGNNVK